MKRNPLRQHSRHRHKRQTPHYTLKHKRTPPRTHKWAWLLTGFLFLFGVGSTSADLVDFAILRLGGEAGIGSPPFSIAVVLPGGIVAYAHPDEGITLPIPGENALVPGRTLTFETTVFNNSETLPADTEVAVVPVGTGLVGNAPNIMPFLRITIFDSLTNELLVGGSISNPQLGVTLGDASGHLGVLSPLGSPPFPDREPLLIPLPPECTTTVTVMIHYLNDPATSALNGGLAALAVQFTGTSTTL
ncbi:hypothetical protein [Lysinibacter sp. HNR]|uniref:hypothetical protein n=1 Tax=Lysinibacter sp. HNR TaxID=3031408 RepID=UPI0024355F0C|nr:hypothetical protein [Lysinibacter sp. HNR]WGD36799.1 hypothetical protein FrondiHNR_10085 [Lysinibacter sp. HNR]